MLYAVDGGTRGAWAIVSASPENQVEVANRLGVPEDRIYTASDIDLMWALSLGQQPLRIGSPDGGDIRRWRNVRNNYLLIRHDG